MPLFEARVEIAPGDADAADAALLDGAFGRWSVLEDIVLRRAWLVGIGEEEAGLRREWGGLAGALRRAGIACVRPAQWRTLADRDWRNSYREHFHPWTFGRLHWVPVWLRGDFAAPDGDLVLWLDPGLAFGTGNHETTRLCCERLVSMGAGDHPGSGGARHSTAERPSDRPGRMIDAGCGSGILALSAALLGFEDVTGFDVDPEAVRVSRENASLNGLGGSVRLFTADLVTGLAGRQAEVVIANIQSDILLRFVRQLVAAVAPRGRLVLGGILACELPQVRAGFAEAARGWTSESRTLGEWSDLALLRPD